MLAYCPGHAFVTPGMAVLAKAWDAVLVRSSFDGEFIDVRQSTGKMQSLDVCVDRLTIFGHDDRASGVLVLFANEMAENH